MTTPRIEEIMNKMPAYVSERTDEVIEEALTEAHQAGIDEAVKVVEALRDDPKGSSCLDCMDWESALDDTIKALQNNK